ncbi:MAG TPA: helix-turn-helix domain-containing protein [Chryseolinea sp.]
MKQLTILVPNGYHNLSSVVGSYEVFLKANAFYQSLGRKPVFKITLASTSKTVKLHDNLFAIKPHAHIAKIARTDLIIIPAVRPDFSQNIRQVKVLRNWLVEMHDKGAEIASICTGAFLLASTGLLESKSCSTHWMAADEFRQMFPGVNLGTDKLITDEDGIYTNGGAFSFLNLLLYLVEKYYDRQTAIYCSKIFQVDIDRQSQSPFTIFSTQKKHGDEVVKKAQVHFENKLSEKISMGDLSSKLNVSRRNFDRRFIKATGNTPVEYLQRAKIEAAKKALETSRKNVNEVMYDVGYSDIKAFREVFRKITGMSPLDYRNKYNKEAAI